MKNNDYKKATRPADVIEIKQAPNFSESFSIISRFGRPVRAEWPIIKHLGKQKIEGPSIWPPTKLSLLIDLYGAAESFKPDETGAFEGRGLAIFDPKYTNDLIEEGLVRELPPYPQKGVTIPGAVCLTEMGKQAAEMLQGRRTVTNYRLPNWLLVELSR